MAKNLPHEKFFKDLIALKSKQELRKKQGINDYNILTSVLSEHDEVRLHSRMIASFLDSQGYHYQDSLFFDLFMETLGLADFEMDNTNLEVITEYNDIDIYITDGARHIIIENKIYASDGEAQIQRYVDSVYKENEELEGTDLLVLYLSIHRSPSQTSLGNLIIKGDKLMKGNESKAYFKNINYATHILPWLERCQKEVKNITNLNMAFDQYAQVVQNITNTNERTKMKLTEMFNSNPEYYEVAQKLIKEMPKFRQEKITTFLNEVQKQLNEKIQDEAQGEWECILNTEKYGKLHQPHLIIKSKQIPQSDSQKQAMLALSFENANYTKCFLGIVIAKYEKTSYEMVKLKDCDADFQDKVNEILDEKEIKEECRDVYWVAWKYYPEDKNEDTDFIQYMLTNRQACANLARWMQTYLDDHKDLIDEINALIKPRHK